MSYLEIRPKVQNSAFCGRSKGHLSQMVIISSMRKKQREKVKEASGEDRREHAEKSKTVTQDNRN